MSSATAAKAGDIYELELKDAKKKVDADTAARVGHAEFVTKDELERRRETLLKDDCLAIRCDVGVTELTVTTEKNGKH
nr:unnamed protein product [Digitaria exilis]